MNRCALALVAALAGSAALGQSLEEQAAERSRIAAERQQVEATYTAEQRACYARFAVNDCLASARSRRSAVLADLRRQEIDLNDAQRRRASSRRQAELEERAAAAARPPQDERPATIRREREARTVQPEPVAPEVTAAPTGPEVATPVPAPRPGNAAAVQRHAQRVAEIEARKARALSKAAERKKPAAAGLPVPP